MGFIYMLKSPSGKSYIGQTIRPIEKRFEKHQRKSSSCVAIYNAIEKYGWENFEKDWYECPDEELNKHERWLVNLMGTLSPDGYNLKEGGGNGKLSEETKQKKREAQLGEKNPMFGKKVSEETKQKKREAQLGEKNPMFGKTGENCPNSKKVYQYDLDGTFIASFGSTEEAARELKKNGKSIANCARGERKTTHGFKWSYVKY